MRQRAQNGDVTTTIPLVTMKNTVIALLALLASAGMLAATPWQKITNRSAAPGQSARFPIWLYRWRRGAPLSAPGYQVMRTDQRRYFQSSDLVPVYSAPGNQVHNKVIEPC